MIYLDSPDKLVTALQKTVDAAPIFDLHTHLYAPVFDKLTCWGIDELLTYHYLLAETFRWRRDMDPAEFYSLSKKEQANIVWQTLFVDNSPISESCRGVLTVISKVVAGPVREQSLDQIREYYDSVTAQQYMDIVFQVSGVREVVMTNDPFDDLERPVWDRNPHIDSRFHTALRIDPLLLHWEKLACPRLQSWGYAVTPEITESTAAEVRRFLNDWIRKINPLYVAISLTPDFNFPDDSVCSQLISQCLLPVCREQKLPWAMMLGVKREMNPAFKMAGDGMGRSDLTPVEYLAREYPDNKFMVTVLSRENQHELCVLGRKFSNLMIFGCWWFLNDPSIIDEMTRERLELLGLSFVPQHSDARVLDQLIYKWHHSKQIIKSILVEKYLDVLNAGWAVTPTELERDVNKLFSTNVTDFLQK